MMILPLVRVGYPLEPRPGEKIVGLISGEGWQMLEYSQSMHRWIYAEHRHKPWPEPLSILCYLPQDGS